MALIRGIGSLFPCPRCLIPEAKQGDHSVSAPLRTEANTKATIQEAREKRLAGDKEGVLKAAGLRDVDVRLCFYYSHLIPVLTTLPTERVLEDQELGPICRVIF